MKSISSSLSIKTKFSNAVHKLLEANIAIPRRIRWRKQKVYTDQEKIALFDEIKKLHDQISEEYSSCLYKNRQKKKIQKLRDESGYTAKKKAKKESGKLFGHVE
jgi:hypothetical protein